MGSKRDSGASISDELFGRKEGKNSSGSGYFSSVFPPSPAGKEATQSDLYSALNKHRADAQTGNGHAVKPESKSQGSGSKGQSGHSYGKDGKIYNPNESAESNYFGSSVHYGARDFYGGSPPKRVAEPSSNYKDESQDNYVATRGDWWQGSLYY